MTFRRPFFARIWEMSGLFARAAGPYEFLLLFGRDGTTGSTSSNNTYEVPVYSVLDTPGKVIEFTALCQEVKKFNLVRGNRRRRLSGFQWPENAEMYSSETTRNLQNRNSRDTRHPYWYLLGFIA